MGKNHEGFDHTQAVIDACPVALIEAFAHSGTIIRVNNAACKLFGYTKTEMVAKQVEILLPMGQGADHVLMRRHYANHPVALPMEGRRLEARRKGGKLIAVEIALRPIFCPGEARVLASVRKAR